MALTDGVSFTAAQGTTADFVFGSARASFLTPGQAVTNATLTSGQTVSYLAQDSLTAPTQREWGHGTFTAASSSITRATINGAVNAGVGGTTAISFNVAPIVSLTALATDISTGTPAVVVKVGTTPTSGGTNTAVLFDDAGVTQESTGMTYTKGTGVFSVDGTFIAAAAQANGGVGLKYISGAIYGYTRGDGALGTGPFNFINNNALIMIQGGFSITHGGVTLVNGLNSDIGIQVGPSGDDCSNIRITGPTGGFSVGGFAVLFSGYYDGHLLYVYNTTNQTLTIVNEDVSSAAANRITTLTGGNVVLRANAPSFATFIYDTAGSRWILTATN